MSVSLSLCQRPLPLSASLPEVGASRDHQPKILIADDEATIADTLELILNQNGFVAVTASDGESAVRIATGWRPDILLTDFVMPRLNGLEAAKIICGLHPRCRVFLLSAQQTSPEFLEDSCALFNGFQFLSKPIHPARLLEVLRASPQPVRPAALRADRSLSVC